MSTTLPPGREQRRTVPRSQHRQWALRSAEERDPVAILEQQAATRVPELVPIRYGRMLASPFAFYRGAAAIMAADLATTRSTELRVQLCGDAHLANFGGFSAPDRALIFDVNDFDETLPGPFEWDVKRLVASFAIAGRHRKFTPEQRARIVEQTVGAYVAAMNEFAKQRRLDVWYARLDAGELQRRWSGGTDDATAQALRRLVRKASQRNSSRAFSRYTTMDEHGNLVPISDPPLVVPLQEVFGPDVLELAEQVVENALAEYFTTLPDDRRVLVEGYRPVGVARKVVGVGSVGTRCWIVLMVAKDDPLDDLVLQVKEAGASVLEPYLGTSTYANHGRRVVEGQRLMQAASDILLGWHRAPDINGVEHDFYVRQMWDGKVSADLDLMPLERYGKYGEICGWTLARAHARSGDRGAIADYLGSGRKFTAAMVEFAESYADQNDADYALVQRAAAEGVITAQPG